MAKKEAGSVDPEAHIVSILHPHLIKHFFRWNAKYVIMKYTGVANKNPQRRHPRRGSGDVAAQAQVTAAGGAEPPGIEEEAPQDVEVNTHI